MVNVFHPGDMATYGQHDMTGARAPLLVLCFSCKLVSKSVSRPSSHHPTCFTFYGQMLVVWGGRTQGAGELVQGEFGSLRCVFQSRR